jgi:hypothetical protein
VHGGFVGEFAEPALLTRAAEFLRGRGYQQIDAYSPFPVPGLDVALGMRRSPLALFVFPIAAIGGVLAYITMWIANAYASPLNVGGRPPHAFFAFVPITFEVTALSAGLSAVFLLFFFSHLPRLSHPLFDIEGFEQTSIDLYFLAVDERDPKFAVDKTQRDLEESGALHVRRFGEAS